MYRYKIVLEEVDDPKYLKSVLEEVGDTYANVNKKKREVTIDTSENIGEICEVLQNEGYEIIEVEMSN